ncbi:DNA-binding GntR family transcriptional regulator [Paraburkholderia atlantica]|uniref:GntR family transcriptional regulator n=1 Tax=Paraburkholderia atlantica TaxID=2654982 RepID=UPI00128C1D80|nr:GntR family transcriptional regulator [Paraburkholderia atlantica]MPW10982.1 GntR family transcriptional regulator [Paraburkholderia atlantica]
MSLYENVRDEILRRIRNGTYARELPIPSAAALSAEFGVSPITIRRAIRDLQAAGALAAIPGKGTYVKAPQRILRQLDLRMSSLHSADIRLISVTREKICDPSMAAIQPPDQVMLCVRKVIFDGDIPFLYDASYLSSHVEDDILEEFGKNFIVDALRSRGIQIVNTRIVAEAAPASAPVGEIFSVPIGYPMLRRVYKMTTSDPGVTIYGVVQAPFDRLACYVNFPAQGMEIKQ